MENNIKTYSSEKVVELYRYLDDPLQKPEERIIELFKDKISTMNMLDIGVGGGRTTKYFAPIVQNYTGIDYSSKLIEVCKKKFAALNFITMDVRDLNRFSENEFDFVLFSFNGIDYISHKDRLQAFREIKRVLKLDGYFYFSSHNIKSIDNWKRIKFSLNPLTFASNIRTYFKRKSISNLTVEKINELQKDNYVLVNDGAHYGELETYYVQTEFQIKTLVEAGYKNIKVFDLKNGKELKYEEIKNNKDGWLYYLCN